MKSTKKMAMLALMTTIALIIFVIESAIPPLVPIPGIKLGLANIVTLIFIMNRMPKEAGIVLLMRIILASIFAGQMMSFIFSLCGGFLCLLAMIIIHHFAENNRVWFTSVIGAIFHNIGQLIAAVIVMQTTTVLYYAPFLLVSGIITGLFTGLCAWFFHKYIPDIRRYFR